VFRLCELYGSIEKKSGPLQDITNHPNDVVIVAMDQKQNDMVSNRPSMMTANAGILKAVKTRKLAKNATTAAAAEQPNKTVRFFIPMTDHKCTTADPQAACRDFVVPTVAVGRMLRKRRPVASLGEKKKNYMR
jgi:hypothetical protein